MSDKVQRRLIAGAVILLALGVCLSKAHAMLGGVGSLMSPNANGNGGGGIPTNAIVTEAGAPLTTEAGAILVTE